MVSRIKKGLTYILLLILVLSNIPNNIYDISQATTYEVEAIKPYAEEVGWFYRYINGRKQQRLWSYTYGRWITDWMWA